MMIGINWANEILRLDQIINLLPDNYEFDVGTEN